MTRMLVVLALCALPAGAGAQGSATPECADSALISVRTDELSATAPLASASQGIDTTYTISVGRKRWSAQDISASAAAGVAGTERASWRACVGAWVTMRRTNVEVANARGTVHLRATLEPLREVLRRHSAGRQQEPGGGER